VGGNTGVQGEKADRAGMSWRSVALAKQVKWVGRSVTERTRIKVVFDANVGG